MSAIRAYHWVEDTQLDQYLTTISMAGEHRKNKSNKIWKEMERANNDVAHDDVESAASLLRGEGCLAKWTKQRGHATNESRE